MPTYVALLRGINVSGQKRIRMEELRAAVEQCGATEVRTYIQSGNVVFAQPARSAAGVRRLLEERLARRFGFEVTTLVLPAARLRAVVRANPFDPLLPEFGSRMYVCFFEREPAAAQVRELQPWITERERFLVRDGFGFAYYADGLGRARLSSALLERKLGPATLRNWNTVTALAEMLEHCD